MRDNLTTCTLRIAHLNPTQPETNPPPTPPEIPCRPSQPGYHRRHRPVSIDPETVGSAPTPSGITGCKVESSTTLVQ
jgi:hypothetical protein